MTPQDAVSASRNSAANRCLPATSSCGTGTKVHPGDNVGMGKDHTLFALVEGKVAFKEKSGGRMYVNVLPMAEAAE